MRTLLGFRGNFGAMSVRTALSLALCFVSLQVQLSFGESNESSCPPTVPISWVEKPPYSTRLSDDSAQNDLQGLFKDILVSFISGICCDMSSELNQTRVSHENEMVRKLQSGEVLVGLPVTSLGRESVLYKDLHFTGFVEYPGADFITVADVKNPGTVVTLTVLKSWPLLMVTTIMMAIAGILVWALDTIWNVREFPRTFFRGSWEGFWWSFISMTTVGYGDKAPRSIFGRLFAMVWILTGLVIMAIFMANITSALTSMKLEPYSKSISGLEVAVLGNGTEYGIAEEEGAKPIVFQTFDEMVKAVVDGDVEGLLVDRYSGYYYIRESNHTNVPLMTSKHIEKSATVGLVFAEGTEELTECLEMLKTPVKKALGTIISSYKAPRQPTPPEPSTIYDTNGPVKTISLVALGILGVLLVLGTVWEFFIRNRSKDRRQSFRMSFTKRKSDHLAMFLERKTGESELRKDLEEGKKLLQQFLEYFEKIERRSQDTFYHKGNKTKANV